MALVAACTGFLTGLPFPRLVLVALGALLVVIQELHLACRYHENWQSYRLIAEGLKRAERTHGGA